MKRNLYNMIRRYRWLEHACLALGATLIFHTITVQSAAGFGGLTDEAVAVWQHRDSATSPTGWDIWYSFLGRPLPTDPTSALTWHAASGPVSQAAPIAALVGDDKNPHVSTNAGVTLAVFQHTAGTGISPGDWDIFYAQFNSATGGWTTPSPVATLSGDDYDPNVAVDSNGNAIVTWVHRNPDGTRDMYYSVWSGGTWSAPASLPVGVSGGQASLPEVSITSISAVGGSLAHTVVAAWSDVPATTVPNHRMLYSIFNGLSWTAPAEIESAATGVGLSISDVGFANYVGTDPDPFGAFGRLGVAGDAGGNAYVVWSGGPTILGLGSAGVVGAILNVTANTWTPMLTPFGSRFIGVGGCENPDDALTTGGGDFVGVFNFAGLIEHTFRTGGVFTSETFSYDSALDDERPSNTTVSATEMVSINWGTPIGPASEIIWSAGTVTPGITVTFAAAANLVPSGLAGEDMFPELTSGFAAALITGFSLTPATSTNPVGSSHTVTATVTVGGSPVSGVTVNYTVSGANTTSGFCVTDATGQCSFTYTGTNAGTDTITAMATIAGAAQSATVSKTWVVVNNPPDCNGAFPSLSEIWPPNHAMVGVHILGVIDPDGDPVTIIITGITQDEPKTGTGIGSGNTCPDGAGVGTSTAQIRAERAGTPKVPGNGRVYEISFTASDGKGGECTGTVGVCIPHDMRPGHICVDDGQIYDSTTCP